MGRKQLSHRIQTGKNNEKATINVKESRQRMHPHLLPRGNTWAGPRNCRAGPYRARVSWASLPCDGPGRAGPPASAHDKLFFFCACHGTATACWCTKCVTSIYSVTSISSVKQDFICARSVGPFGPPEDEKGVLRNIYSSLRSRKREARTEIVVFGKYSTPQMFKNLLFLAKLEFLWKSGRVPHHFQYKEVTFFSFFPKSQSQILHYHQIF